jgi:hypothetical protein
MEVMMLDARRLMEGAARGGARVVWLPTFQAGNQLAYQSRPGGLPHRADLQVAGRSPEVPIFGPDGRLEADAEAVLEIVRIVNPPYSTPSMPELAARIRAVGPGTTVMATDFGQTHNPTPAEGLEAYIRGLLDSGFTAAEARPMVGEHARALLDV